jgi:chemotaxis protein histidine kinase CheA
LFEIRAIFKKENNENELYKKIDIIHETANSLGLEYISSLFEILQVLTKEKIESKKSIKNIFKKSWEYLIFFCTLENNNLYTNKERKEIKDKIIKKRSVDEFSFLKEESTLIHFFKKMEEKGRSYSSVLEEVAEILTLTYDEFVSYLVQEENLTKVVSEMFYELKKGFNLERLNSLEGYFKRKEDFFHKFKHCFFENEGFFEASYLRNVDIIKILNTFCIHSDVIEEVKPQIYDVLVENYNQCFETFSKIVEQNKKIDHDTLDKIFEKLLHVPIKQSFYKFQSIVKVISKSLGKKINFRVIGENGALEKERLNLLQDVMVHLVRNSIDHGIEEPSQRILKGKEEVGTIEIGCSQVRDKIFQVTIKDDGGGIDINRIVQKVIEKELLGEEELKKMNEKEKLDLIFLPNFSTKEHVSEISGRGIGMDVVKKNLENIGADFEVKTEKDYGTEFVINFDMEKK